jgi:hypothetical protein
VCLVLKASIRARDAIKTVEVVKMASFFHNFVKEEDIERLGELVSKDELQIIMLDFEKHKSPRLNE